MDNFTRSAGRWSNHNLTTEYVYYNNVLYDQEYLDFREHVQLINDLLILIRIIVCSFGAALNLSSVLILIKIRWRGKPIFKLILSLAVSDMLLAVLHFIFIFVAVPTIWNIHCLAVVDFQQTCSGHQTIPILSFMYVIPQTAGLVNMFSLAVDLLLAVKKPFRHRELMSGRRVNILIICTWVVPAIVALAMGIGDIYLRQEYNFIPEGILGIAATTLIVVLSNVSFFVFVILYLVIYCGIRSAMANFPRQQTNNLRKATVTTLLIVITYAICMTPVTLGTLIVLLNNAFKDERKSLTILIYAMSEIVQTLFVLNTVFDPLIYAIRIRKVRETYTGILCRCQRQRQGGSSVDGTPNTRGTAV